VLIELGLEDGADALARGRTDGKRAATSGLQALIAVVLGQIQQAQTSAVALLGMRTVVQLPLDHIAHARTDAVRPVEQSPWGPLQVLAVRLGHVLG